MVFIRDEGSEFNAPLDKVWALLQSEGEHAHPSRKNRQVAMDGQSPVISFDTQAPDGRNVHVKAKVTMHPPVGFTIEHLEGDMAGSKVMQYYTPKGKKTGVTVVGEWVSNTIPQDQLKKIVTNDLEVAFNEDQQNLKKMM